MPQLNPEFFVSQFFWLTVTFSFLLFFLWKISLPRISRVLEKRENKINNDIESAKKLQTEAEKIQTKIDQQLFAIREQVAESIKETTIRLQNNISIELQKIDSELSKKVDESLKTIEKNKYDAFKNIKIQIQEITKLTLSKLIRIDVTNEEINDTIRLIQNRTVN